MASVFFRGAKAAPRWYARYKDPRGSWVSRRVRQETRRDALRVAQTLEAKAERQRLGMEAPEQAGFLCGALMRKWAGSLINRSADTDRSRLENHVFPRWSSARLVDVTLASLMTWLDEMRDAGKIGPASQRHALALVSRFFSWAVERGFAQMNPCRMIPPGRRPRPVPPRDVPWIADDATARRLLIALPAPFDLLFYVGNRTGMRLGEICGLRLSDLDELGAGAIRVRYSYDGPLKEDRHGVGKLKFVPAPADALEVLGPHVERRRSAGAGPEDFVFVGDDGRHFIRHAIAYRWRIAAKALDLPAGMNFYRATRHSFCSRNLAAGASLDEVSQAMGHATPAITARAYNHYVRRRFSPILTAGLGLETGSNVVAIRAVTRQDENSQITANEEQDHAD